MGSPKDWKLDASEDQQMVECGDDGISEEVGQVKAPKGSRMGGRRSMYLTGLDFERRGSSDGCVGCKDLASGGKGPVGCPAPHTSACRRRMEMAIQTDYPCEMVEAPGEEE